MNLDTAIGIVARMRLSRSRACKSKLLPEKTIASFRLEKAALSLVMWAAKDVADLRRELASKSSPRGHVLTREDARSFGNFAIDCEPVIDAEPA